MRGRRISNHSSAIFRTERAETALCAAFTVSSASFSRNFFFASSRLLADAEMLYPYKKIRTNFLKSYLHKFFYHFQRGGLYLRAFFYAQFAEVFEQVILFGCYVFHQDR